ncbi:GerMN domain-containing protein [Phytohabitans houttuyneae]|uniref:Uncharacterized protein n=2 Tax=Phytohabitans houttuyneae TaxID=1076126 RepID=A0A6V8KGV9_9ACTN|nr:Gmad2 immunoglobulin-like domain-containing protein [Phytohabitans houttuyneae]GFJ80937.1 hypothetical protein Phou_051170 [Phytohabitans houttuyneae]
MTVKVFFHLGQDTDPDTVVAVNRTVPRTTKVATAALTALLAGPTRAEQDSGYWSHFSPATAGMLRSVRIANGAAHADFRDLRKVIPNASSSAGSAALLAELNATLKQFDTVRTTVYSLNGDVAAFYEWLQMVPPVGQRAGLTDARRAAADFLTGVVGMRNLAPGSTRWRSDFIVTSDFRTRIAGTETATSGPITRVTLGGSATGFTVLGVNTDTIKVDSPKSAVNPDYYPVARSPLTISGSAWAFEGHVNVRVVQDRYGTVRRLGEGYVIGGGDELRPYTGQVRFTAPSAPVGWVVAAELSAVNGQVAKATAVKVRFAGVPADPSVLSVRATARPALRDLDVEPPDTVARNGWVMPTGRGTITFVVQAKNTTRVHFNLTPLTPGSPPTRLLGTASRSGGEFVFTWRYADEPLLARMSLTAINATGHTDRVVVNVFHP